MQSIYDKRQAEIGRLRTLSPMEDDPDTDATGVVYSNLIIKYSTAVDESERLIRPFEHNRLHAAGYKLTVGDEFYLEGKFRRLPGYHDAVDEERASWIDIPPFQVAVIKTAETICMPRFLIGRWNIVVKMAYKGLLWVGGAQVDPGYIGCLFCPIYNLSSKTVRLHERDEIALMDFVKTTRFPYRDDHRNEKWIRQPLTDKPIIEDYVSDLRSALFTEAGEKVKAVEGDLKSLEGRFAFNTQVIIAALALIPAILATMLPFPGASVVTASIWGPIAIGFSTFAFVSSLLRWLHRRQESNHGQRPVLYASLVAITLAVVTLYFTYSFTAGYVERIATWRFSEERVATDLHRVQNDISRLEREMVEGAGARQEEIEELRERLEELRSVVERSSEQGRSDQD